MGLLGRGDRQRSGAGAHSRLYEAIARIPQIAGICYTQLYDVEQEVNGLMTYDRRMKFDPQAIRAINSLLI